MTKQVSVSAASIALEQRLKQGELQLKAQEAQMAQTASNRSPDNDAASDGLARRIDAGGKGEGEKRLSGTRPEEIDDKSKLSHSIPPQKHGLALANKQAHKQEVRALQHESVKAPAVTDGALHQSLDQSGYTRQQGPTKPWFEGVARNKEKK